MKTLNCAQRANVWLPVLLGLMVISIAWMAFNSQFSIGDIKRLFSGDASLSASARRVTLTLSTWGNEGETQTLRRLIQNFETSHPDVRVTLRHMPEYYTQSLQMLIAAGQTPDIMMLSSLDIKRFCDSELLIDLNSLPNSFDIKAFYPNAVKSLQGESGALCGLPRDVSDMVIYVNHDWLSTLPEDVRLKANPLWTMQDMQAVAKAVVDGESPTPALPLREGESDPEKAKPKRWPLWFYQAPAMYWLPFVWSEGGNAFSPIASPDKGRAQNPPLQTREIPSQKTFQLDQTAIDALATYKAFRFDKGFSPTRETIANTTMTELFIQQRILFMLSGRWTVPFLRENADFHWDVLPFPQGKVGSKVGVDATGYSLSASTQHPEEAQELLRFLTSEHTLRLWAKSGLIVPARINVANSEAFLQADQLPQHADHFLSAIKTGVPSPYPKDWPRLGQKINTTMDAYLNTKELSLKEAFEKNGLQDALDIEPSPQPSPMGRGGKNE